MEDMHEIFQLTLSNEAFQQYSILLSEIENLDSVPEADTWTYIWGRNQFSVHKLTWHYLDKCQLILSLSGYGNQNVNQSTWFSFG
jgi:hypothetical protein